MTVHVQKCLQHHILWFLGQSCGGPGSMTLLTQAILWFNKSNLVLLHMYIRYVEVCNLPSHTTAGVYFKKLSPNIASYTEKHFYFYHISDVFQWLWTTATKFIWNYSLWPDSILTYMHFIQPLASCPHFLPLAVKIWWTLLFSFTAGTCGMYRTVNETEPELAVPPGGHTTPCLSVHSLPLSITLSLRILLKPFSCVIELLFTTNQ